MASKYLQKFPVPEKFPEILHDFAMEILRDQPEDIIDYGFEYFKALDEGIGFEYANKGKNIPPAASRKEKTAEEQPKKEAKQEPKSKPEPAAKPQEKPVEEKKSKPAAEPQEKPKKDEPKPKMDEPKPKKDEPKPRVDSAKETEDEAKKYVSDMIEKLSQDDEEEEKDEEEAPVSKPAPKAAAKKKVTVEEANEYHEVPIPGKYQTMPCKPLNSEKDLRLAYAPGVAFPCEEIAKDKAKVYEYTAKSNAVCVISNGTAVLGLGNIGAAASKPVMEGKGCLMKKFGDVNGVDLEVNTTDPDEFINCVKLLGSSYGGINLEDIRGPDCFYIENKLKEIMDIPVFHDDQHGTAIIVAAGLINACYLRGKDMGAIKVVFNGAGAAGIACLQMVIDSGVDKKNVILCDSNGPIYKGRTKGMNDFKEKFIAETDARTLEEALIGADVFVGVSAKDALKPEWLKKMNDNPIIFALANPDPEILPEKAKEVVPEAIIATGRSDYPNQINNVMCFPYLFRGALDVRAKTITEKMKVATAQALAGLAREEVPQEVKDIFPHRSNMEFGPDYIIPTPFDPRLLIRISTAVAKAACEDEGNASLGYSDWSLYETHLQERINRKNQQMAEITKA